MIILKLSIIGKTMLLKFCFQFQANCNSVTNTCLAAWEIPDWPVLKLLLGEGNLKAKWWYANKVIRSDEKRERDDYQSIFAVEKRKCPFIFLGKNAVINDEIKEMIKKGKILMTLFWYFIFCFDCFPRKFQTDQSALEFLFLFWF